MRRREGRDICLGCPERCPESCLCEKQLLPAQASDDCCWAKHIHQHFRYSHFHSNCHQHFHFHFPQASSDNIPHPLTLACALPLVDNIPHPLTLAFALPLVDNIPKTTSTSTFIRRIQHHQTTLQFHAGYQMMGSFNPFGLVHTQQTATRLRCLCWQCVLWSRDAAQTMSGLRILVEAAQAALIVSCCRHYSPYANQFECEVRHIRRSGRRLHQRSRHLKSGQLFQTLTLALKLATTANTYTNRHVPMPLSDNLNSSTSTCTTLSNCTPTAACRHNSTRVFFFTDVFLDSTSL